ncbi:MAG: beta-ketoacyl-ACP synthase II [Rhizobacter sp.]|nr:beta-ketoacyl-ACP synthase II [Chlorobiales bacterium]
MTQMKRRIAVTGIGTLTPIGLNPHTFWDGMMHSQSGSATITAFDPAPHETKFACELKGYKAEDYMDRKSANRMDRYCQVGVASGEMALKDSGLDLSKTDLDRFGVVFGSGIGGMISYDHQFKTYINGGPDRVSPFFIPQLIPDMAAGQLSIRNKLKGPNYATVSACATSLNAIIDAYMILQLGYADLMLCGGSEASITPMGIAGFNASKAMSLRNDDPATASRPYDIDRDGFVMGEGAGALVLETFESAEKRGAKIYAELLGVGMSGDAYHITAPHPEGDGVVRVINAALRDAGIEAEQIDYINTHGTSTSLGDIAELQAIKKVFGEHTYKLNISSTKSMTGHLLGAAGVVESVACIMALQHQTVPPTINIKNLDPAVDVNVTPNVPQQREINYVLNNGFGFGGHNATAIFKRI